MNGWSLPFSPKGLAATLTPPPWHYSGDLLAIEFETSPELIRALLPDDLEPADSNQCIAVFADWSATADSDPRLAEDPRRGMYKEAFIIIPTRHQDKTAGRVPYIWVDNEVAHARGNVQGFPKKMGEIFMNRPVTLGQGGPKREPGHSFAATLSAMGRHLMRAKVTLEAETGLADLPPLLLAPQIHTRYLASLDAETAPLHEHSINTLSDVGAAQAMVGTAELEFFPSEHEELADLPLVSVGRGYFVSVAMTVTGATTLPASSE
ncbi:acetoacetate decarboxylase family protein [Neptuniibacter halophilus]|uniref:acetoacetate decarboxylase family protein n=1 Tax=Neptuniibacter halophilus TaxID=651666 RepID=UPI002572E456|nr:acetoacetate decarboxylase family protein [Neptuniibacter halophilus]